AVPDDLRLRLLHQFLSRADTLRNHALSHVLRHRLCVISEMVESGIFGVAGEYRDLVYGGVRVVEVYRHLVEHKLWGRLQPAAGFSPPHVEALDHSHSYADGTRTILCN